MVFAHHIPTAEIAMARFDIATIDGKNIAVELEVPGQSAGLAVMLENALKPGGFLLAREVIKAPDRRSMRDIFIFGSAIVAIREAQA